MRICGPNQPDISLNSRSISRIILRLGKKLLRPTSTEVQKDDPTQVIGGQTFQVDEARRQTFRIWSATRASAPSRNARQALSSTVSSRARCIHSIQASRSASPMRNGRCRARRRGWPNRSTKQRRPAHPTDEKPVEFVARTGQFFRVDGPQIGSFGQTVHQVVKPINQALDPFSPPTVANNLPGFPWRRQTSSNQRPSSPAATDNSGYASFNRRPRPVVCPWGLGLKRPPTPLDNQPSLGRR